MGRHGVRERHGVQELRRRKGWLTVALQSPKIGMKMRFKGQLGEGRFEQMDERIVIDPDIQHGKPVIRGTRVPVTRIVGGLAGGMTKEEIMREYEVTEEDIWAALNYATELIEAEEFHPLPIRPGQDDALSR